MDLVSQTPRPRGMGRPLFAEMTKNLKRNKKGAPVVFMLLNGVPVTGLQFSG